MNECDVFVLAERALNHVVEQISDDQWDMRTLPDGLVQGLWDELSPVAEAWRKIGVFGHEIAVPDDAPLVQRLLGLTGRDPR
ncbi:MAG: hypothetical protein WCB51_05135 [Candidatus Dormiibacterota bacterium]